MSCLIQPPQIVNFIFFGTSLFAADFLTHFRAACPLKLNILAIFTQPDKPAGRDKKITFSPVKKIALAEKITLFQPTKIKPELISTINEMRPDLFLVAAYGKILPEFLLNIPPFGSLNIHPSLLPLYRGPSPIQTAIANDERQTGFSIIKLDQLLDHGPLVAQEKIAITETDSTPTLSQKIALQAGNLLGQLLTDYLSGKIRPVCQEHSRATFSSIITKENGLLRPEQTARQIYKLWRAYDPWPGICLEQAHLDNGKTISTKITAISESQPIFCARPPLTLYSQGKKLLLACAQKQALFIDQLQPAGKKAIAAAEFINGYLRPKN